MLVLGRSVGQRCQLTISGEFLKSGQSLELDIELVSIRGSSVRLGFDGPREIKVVRKEITENAAR